MPTITGASRRTPGVFLDKGGAAYNALHPDFGATGLGSADDRAAFALMDSVGVTSLLLPAGTYRVASNYSFTKPVVMMPGALLKPDSGVALAVQSGFQGPNAKLFDLSAGGTVTFASTAQVPILYAVWWGAIGDGVTDDYAALQAFCTACIGSQIKGKIAGGTFSIGTPIILGWKVAGAWVYSSFDIEGEKMVFNAQQLSLSGTQIVPTYTNTFGIGIQNGRAFRLKDVYVLGKNDWSGSVTTNATYGYVMTNSNMVINSCRDSRYSPYSGVVVDPFGTSTPADGGYPGLTANYLASAAGSATGEFNNVTVQGFVSGFCLGPNGTIANCSEMEFLNCQSMYNKNALSICQSQSRNINWRGGSILGALYAFEGRNYGAQQGGAPHIYGCNMGITKYLFNVNGAFGFAPHIEGIHAESFASLGFFGNGGRQQPFTFVGCEFSFYDFAGVHADLHLYTLAPMSFVGCSLSFNGVTWDQPCRVLHPANGQAPISFIGTTFWPEVQKEFWLAPTQNSNNSGRGFQDLLFLGSTFADTGTRGSGNPGGGLSSDYGMLDTLSALNKTVVPMGARLRSTTSNPSDFFFVGGNENSADQTISAGTVTVTTGANGTASFTAPDATIHRQGDLIFTTGAVTCEIYDGTTTGLFWICIGIVSGVVGSVVTLTGVGQNFATGSYALKIGGWPRYHSATTGDTNSSTSLTNVANAAAWAVGNRVKGVGIPNGAYITAIAGTTVTISKAATATAVGVRLYDADVRLVTGSAV
jgi:hypothetical protein